jgi:ribose transport system permease protein
LLLWLMMTRTVHGRNAYAIGNNRDAAVNAGISVGPHFMLNFMLIGFLAALSAVVFYSESGSVNPNDGMLLRAMGDHSGSAGWHQADRGLWFDYLDPWRCDRDPVVAQGAGAYRRCDTQTVNLVIGLILIAVLFLDRQLNLKGKAGVEDMTEMHPCSAP